MLTLYKLWFKHSRKDIGIELMCILALIIATNKLYSYEHLVELIPQIEKTEQYIIILGLAASIIIVMSFCAIFKKIRSKCVCQKENVAKGHEKGEQRQRRR